MFYVLNAAPANPLSWVLDLKGYRTLAECDRAIAWQVAGDFGDAGDWLICEFSRAMNRFRVVAMPSAKGYRPAVPPTLAACTWAPQRGPYAPDAWASFCGRLGYDPDGDVREPKAARSPI